MSTQMNIYANTVTALLSHRIVDITLSVEIGQLNVLIGERLYTLSAGQNLTVPKNTLYAYANLSPVQAVVTERVDTPTFAKDIVVHADVNGVIYDTLAGPSMQISHSLYLGLVDMLVAMPQKMSA